MKTIKKLKRSSRKNHYWMIVAVCVAVTAGVGLIGPATAMWPESIHIFEQVNTGDMSAEFVVGDECAEDGPSNVDGEISSDGKTLSLLMSDRRDQEGWYENTDSESAEDSPQYYYAAGEAGTVFTIENKGSVSMKITTAFIDQDASSEVFGVTGILDGTAFEDLASIPVEIEPGETISGSLEIDWSTINDVEENQDPFTFTIIFSCEQWNTYLSLDGSLEGWEDTLNIEGVLEIE